jgi:hypothetical protein
VKRSSLGVEPESVTAFCASKELCCALIACAGLHLPRVSQVVSALWTIYFGGGISFQPFVFLSYDHNCFSGLLRSNRFGNRGLGFFAVTDWTNKNSAVFGSLQYHPFST